MKNKKFMLLAVGAMAVVALGTAGVGTAAWFTAGQAAPQGAAGSTGSITAKESEASLGQWTVTVTPHIDNANIVLTKDQANAATYVYVDSSNPEVAASKPSSAVWAAEMSFTAHISYVGDMAFANKDAAEAAFATAIGSKKAHVAVAASGDAAGLVRYVSGNSGTGDMATKASGNEVDITNSELLALTITNTSPYKTGVESSTLTNKIYVALTGTNSNQDALKDAAATLTLTVTIV